MYLCNSNTMWRYEKRFRLIHRNKLCRVYKILNIFFKYRVAVYINCVWIILLLLKVQSDDTTYYLSVIVSVEFEFQFQIEKRDAGFGYQQSAHVMVSDRNSSTHTIITKVSRRNFRFLQVTDLPARESQRIA